MPEQEHEQWSGKQLGGTRTPDRNFILKKVHFFQVGKNKLKYIKY